MTRGTEIKSERILAIDILRGFDIFCLIFLFPFLSAILRAFKVNNFFTQQLTHVNWEGIAAFDMIMPFFMFLVGVSIPFAINNHRQENWGNGKLWLRLFKRVILLWFFGLICQGNLLSLNPSRIYLYNNTLQSIAIGALIATPIAMYIKKIRWIIFAICALLIIYYCGMNFIKIDGVINYDKFNNFAMFLDKQILGRFVDGASMQNGNIIFSDYYDYAWIFPSLNFSAMVLFGVLASKILQEENMSAKRKNMHLFFIGLGLIIFSFLLFEPCIKKIFTSSFTLRASGFSFLILAFFYFIMDILKWQKGFSWLKIYGLNSILVYFIYCVIPVGAFSRHLVFGLQQFSPNFYQVVLILVDGICIFILLKILNRAKIYLRV